MPLIHFLGEQFGNLKLCTDTKERHKCPKGELCWDSPTRVRSLLNGSLGALWRNQLTHPMISTSSREYLVTDHWVSVPIYLHRLGRLHGRRCRWAELWNVLEREGPELWTQVLSGLTSGQALHLADLSVFICKTQTPMAANSWCAWDSNTMSVKHLAVPSMSLKWNHWPPSSGTTIISSLVQKEPGPSGFARGTQYISSAVWRGPSPPTLNYHHHYLLLYAHYLRTGFPQFCVYRVRAVLGGYQQ